MLDKCLKIKKNAEMDLQVLVFTLEIVTLS